MSILEYTLKVAIPVFLAFNYLNFVACLGCSALYACVNDKEKRKENFKRKFIENITDISEFFVINLTTFVALLLGYTQI